MSEDGKGNFIVHLSWGKWSNKKGVSTPKFFYKHSLHELPTPGIPLLFRSGHKASFFKTLPLMSNE